MKYTIHIRSIRQLSNILDCLKENFNNVEFNGHEFNLIKTYPKYIKRLDNGLFDTDDIEVCVMDKPVSYKDAWYNVKIDQKILDDSYDKIKSKKKN